MNRLTTHRLQAIQHALSAALAGAGFDGGDFDGEDREDYEKALAWAEAELDRRARDRFERVHVGRDRE